MTATRYRKKPVVIEAMGPLDGTIEMCNDVLAWIGSTGGQATRQGGSKTPRTIVIPTLEGDMTAGAGDYVIRGIKGEHYPCRGDIFEATYEPAGD